MHRTASCCTLLPLAVVISRTKSIWLKSDHRANNKNTMNRWPNERNICFWGHRYFCLLFVDGLDQFWKAYDWQDSKDETSARWLNRMWNVARNENASHYATSRWQSKWGGGKGWSQGSHASLKVLEFFSPKFKALKVLANRTGAWKSLNFIPLVLGSPWIHQVKLRDIGNFV